MFSIEVVLCSGKDHNVVERGNLEFSDLHTNHVILKKLPNFIHSNTIAGLVQIKL